MAMASQVFPPAKRRRVVAPSFDHHRLPCFPNTYQPAPEFQYQKIPAANPVPTMGNNKPVCFHPMQGQGFFVKNPNPGIDVVPTPRMVKPTAPVQGFQRHQYGQQGFVRSQLHLQSQSFYVQNRSVDAFSFTSSTVNRGDQVQCLNQHPHPVAPVSNQVTLDQLSTSVLSMLVQSIKAQQGLLIAQQPKEEEPVEEDVPSDFDASWLKVRHESVIKSLYSDIPRQCSTCGRRFKTQEEHGKHMDWHVFKNREIKKTKQVKRSKPWFFTPSLWLKATEILTESNNGGPVPEFLKRDSILEMEKDEDILRVPRDEDFIVLGDEDQRFCALCMEAFEEFYSDETEDWMYKGAVYMNAPKGSMASGKDRSQLGPIVHFKCLPDSRQL